VFFRKQAVTSYKIRETPPLERYSLEKGGGGFPNAKADREKSHTQGKKNVIRRKARIPSE